MSYGLGTLAFVGELVRLRLVGPEAEPGRIPAVDVARLLQGYERAVACAAEARMRRRARTGRRGATVEAATRLIFRGTERGSLVAVLELPEVADNSGTLDLDDAHLGELATGDVLGLLEDPHVDAAAGVVEALAQLGDELGIGSRYQELIVEVDPGRHVGRGSASFTADTREQLNIRRWLKAADDRAQADRVTGTLVEADFEALTAHVRTPDHRRLVVRFTAEQADEIQDALRQPSELEGWVVYDSRTHAVRSVELRRIVRPEQLQALADTEAFWSHRSVDDLAAQQGVGPIHDLEVLVAREATEEELDEFLDALGC